MRMLKKPPTEKNLWLLRTCGAALLSIEIRSCHFIVLRITVQWAFSLIIT
jgi:hypothetical protein